MTIEEPKARNRRKRAAAPTTPDPIEIAMEAEAEADGDSGEDSPARRVLLKHEQLLGWQIMKERAGFGLRVLTGCVGVIAAALIGSLIWSASQERGLVIEPFSVPPEFAENGVTGQVVASRLLDRLSAMSDQTQSVRAPSTYANNWNGDIKVQIPQTGVSVGELRRYLVEWLGHQTTIGGELIRTPDGLSLIARTGTATATPVTGEDELQLDAMIQAAAEQVYATTQPYRYAIYLARDGDEAALARSREALRALTRSADEADRMWGYAALNLRLQGDGDYQGAIEAAGEAIAIAPKFNLAYANRAGAYAAVGLDEAAHRDDLTALRTAHSDGHRFMREEGLAFVKESWLGASRFEVGDYEGAAEAYSHSLAVRPADGQSRMILGFAQALLHEPSEARRSFDAVLEQGGNVTAVGSAIDPRVRSEMAVRVAVADGDWYEVIRRIGGVDMTGVTPQQKISVRNTLYPMLVNALVRVGDSRRARLVAAGLSENCYRCVIARAVAAEASGDRAEADRWFAEAVRQGPSLPFAHEAWGRARFARGDIVGAIAFYEQAIERGPRWADPQKDLGDALMSQGDEAGAIRKYRAAAERAPRWGALHLAWGRALEAQGGRDQAREKYTEAARKDLSAADRAEVVRRRRAV